MPRSRWTRGGHVWTILVAAGLAAGGVTPAAAECPELSLDDFKEMHTLDQAQERFSGCRKYLDESPTLGDALAVDALQRELSGITDFFLFGRVAFMKAPVASANYSCTCEDGATAEAYIAYNKITGVIVGAAKTLDGFSGMPIEKAMAELSSRISKKLGRPTKSLSSRRYSNRDGEESYQCGARLMRWDEKDVTVFLVGSLEHVMGGCGRDAHLIVLFFYRAELSHLSAANRAAADAERRADERRTSDARKRSLRGL